jgi:hypothetical protein
MDPSLFAGTGLLILGAVVWVVCAYYAYQMAPRFGRSRGTWTVLTVIFGPLALMALYVLPRKQAAPGHGMRREDQQAALYEKPKKR